MRSTEGDQKSPTKVGCRGLAPRSSVLQTDATLRLAHSPCQYPRSESNRRAPIESRRSLPLDDGGQCVARAHVRNCTETARVQAGSSTLELRGRESIGGSAGGVSTLCRPPRRGRPSEEAVVFAFKASAFTN